MSSQRISILGAGSWGTTFAKVLADSGHTVTLWARTEAIAQEINEHHTNRRYLPESELSALVRADTDPERVLAGAELVVIAVPAQSLRENLQTWGAAIPAGVPVVSLMKGIEIGTGLRMSEVIAQVGQVDPELIAVISGPNLAREIARREPSAATIACTDPQLAQHLQEICSTPYFRPYWTADVIGVEIGGALKNVIAIANGLAAGIGYGENTQASVMTRGLAEMTRLAVALGGKADTMAGLAGVGDLIATCQSNLSRNRTFGELLGRGKTVAEAKALMNQTCEGVKAARPLLELAESIGVDLPITRQVVGIVHDGVAPQQALVALMSRNPKPEGEQRSS